MIQPAPESAVAVEGPTYSRLIIIPDGDANAVPAVVFLRCTPAELDSNVGDRWSSIALLNGEIVDDFTDYASRVELIADTVKAMAAKAAGSRKKASKAAAEILTTYVTGAMANYTADDYGPVADEDGGEIWGVGAGDEEQEQTPANAGELAGVEGDGVDDPAPAAVTEEEAVRVFKTRMLALSQQLVDAVLSRTSLEVQLKAAKAHEKEVIDEIQSASARGPERMPLFDGRESTATQPPQARTSEASESGDGQAATDTTTDHNAWRAVSIEALGLPPKLADRLEETGISTIGALEDKRAEFDGLRGISGIGPAKVTVIEDAVVGWLSKNRDRAVFEAVAAESNRDE